MTTRIPSSCFPGVRPPFSASNSVKYPQTREKVSRISAAVTQPRAMPCGGVISLAIVVPPNHSSSNPSHNNSRSRSPAATRDPTPASSNRTSTCSGVSTP